VGYPKEIDGFLPVTVAVVVPVPGPEPVNTLVEAELAAEVPSD